VSASDEEQARALDRLLTFVDAVVAIAITLLVLPLVEITGDVGDGLTVEELLREHSAEFWAFLLSFAVISRLWLIQHRTMRHVSGFHDRIAHLLVLWMLSIVFLPFPTALVAEAPDDALTKILYIGTMAIGTVWLALVQVTVVRMPELSDGEGFPDPAAAWATVGAMMLALAVTLAFPSTSYFPLLLLLLPDLLLRWVRRIRAGG